MCSVKSPHFVTVVLFTYLLLYLFNKHFYVYSAWVPHAPNLAICQGVPRLDRESCLQDNTGTLVTREPEPECWQTVLALPVSGLQEAGGRKGVWVGRKRSLEGESYMLETSMTLPAFYDSIIQNNIFMEDHPFLLKSTVCSHLIKSGWPLNVVIIHPKLHNRRSL